MDDDTAMYNDVDDDMVTDIDEYHGITTVALGEKYLALPAAMGRSTEENFEHIKLNGWGCNISDVKHLIML